MLNSGWSSRQTSSSFETFELARQWATHLSPNSVVLLYGDLGAGKTTFVKGLAKGLEISQENIVQSPTFTYLHIYEGGRLPIFHFDLYRLHSCEDFYTQGFDEFLEREGVCCIEWPDKIQSLLRPPYWQVKLTHQHLDTRLLQINYYG